MILLIPLLYCIAIVVIAVVSVVGAVYLHLNKHYRSPHFVFSDLSNVIVYCAGVAFYGVVLLLVMLLAPTGLNFVTKLITLALALMLLGIVVSELVLQRRYNRFMQQQRLQPSPL